MTARFSPHQAWLVFFGVWTVILSGVFADFVGTPGLVQWRKLESLYQLKRIDQNRLEADLERMQNEIVRMEKDTEVQRREIRRVLGYLAPDEMVFEFEDPAPAPGSAPQQRLSRR